MNTKRAKAVFVGHGSPMNALGDNPYADGWRDIGKACGPVEAILCVSAHWYTKETRVAVTDTPKTIHDFYGFPRELYELRYEVPGAPDLARQVATMLAVDVKEDAQWGLDHGAWSVLRHMYPAEMGIPVFQLSIERTLTTRQQYGFGRALALLREQGVLIIASGNVVHNLGRIDWNASDGYDWAKRFDKNIHDAILAGRHDDVLDSLAKDGDAKNAVPTRDHFDPLCYVLGSVDPTEPVAVYNKTCLMGSISMTSYVFG